ncbi:TauD/TfdA family dioxygenase [Aspergillus stella-maris]|uniref:TauD/TfdA family dioxygenase n=1 Tax=Aspergillus stella-maris TaxID=1810926 RepID=UPI003CCDE484
MAPSAVSFPPANPFVVAPEAYYSSGLRARFLLDADRTAAKPKTHSPATYAKIGYEVDEVAYRKRVQASLAAEDLPQKVPAGWPTRLSGPLVWDKEDFPDETEYVYYLTDEDKREISEALEIFKGFGLGGHEVSQTTFPLPSLGKTLAKVRSDVYEGRGFSIVRGLDPDAYAMEDLTVVYLGISSYIGERRGKQDQRGSMLMHVIKRGDQQRDVQYTEDKPFHTDTVTDCLCLFTKSLSEKGGRSILASAWTVYNEIAATRPDIIHVMAESNWPFDTFGRSPSYYTRPILFYHHDKLITSFSRRLLVGHVPFDKRSPGIPGLTEAQAEALDMIHFVARKHEINPRIERGDLRFINNMAILHRREAFENSAGKARHLIRIWLNNKQMCWKLPRSLQLSWARIFEDDEREEHWDLEPPRKDGKILRVAGSCD